MLYLQENTDNELWNLMLLKAKTLDILYLGFLKALIFIVLTCGEEVQNRNVNLVALFLVENTNASSSNFKVFHPYLCHFETAFLNSFSHNFSILMHQYHLNATQKTSLLWSLWSFKTGDISGSKWRILWKAAEASKSKVGMRIEWWRLNAVCNKTHCTIAIQIFSVK